VIGLATFVAYLIAYAGPDATEEQKVQAGTTALITLIMIAVWVLAIVARPYVWWKVVLIATSILAYLVLFTVPFTREFFKLDPSNVGLTTAAFICGAVGIVLVEIAWWISTAINGGQHTLVPASPGGSA